MEKSCLEAIQVTSTLATTTEPTTRGTAHADRFWELYYAPMYIVELRPAKTYRWR